MCLSRSPLGPGRSIAVALAGWVSLAIAGCGGAPALKQVNPAPGHGGSVSPLSTGGFVEVLTEAPGASGRATKLVLVAYFLSKDGATSMSPPPTDVSIKVGSMTEGATVPLKASGEAGRFASEPVDIRPGFQGTLKASVNGSEATAELLLR